MLRIVNMLPSGLPRNREWISGTDKRFCCDRKVSHWLWDRQGSNPLDTEGSFLVDKAIGREANHFSLVQRLGISRAVFSFPHLV